MNKKGEWTLLQTITVVGGIIAALILTAIVYRYTSQERAEFSFTATDSALLVDAILSTPGDVQLAYPQPFVIGYIKLGNYSISVLAHKPGPNEDSLITHYFIPRSDIQILEGDLKLSRLYFIKQGGTFRLDNKPASD